MKSVRYAIAGTIGLAVLFAALSMLSGMASHRAAPGQELAFGWRLAVWITLQITVYAPLLFVPLGLLTLLGAWRSAPMTLAEARRLLGWWLLIGVVAPVLAFACFAAVGFPALFHFVLVGVAFTHLAFVAWLACIVVAIHLQSRLGSRFRGWHVAALSIPLLLLWKPVGLIPPAIVWWTSRRAAV